MKTWNKIWATGLLALTLALTAGCGSTATPTKSTEPAKQETPVVQDSAKTTYPLTLTDATGESVTFDKAPAKIISLAPSETESLFAIGLDQEIVGVTEYDDYPAAAKSKPKMSGMKVNMESIVAAQPDVVFVAALTDAETIKNLRAQKIKVYQFNPKTLDDVTKDIEVYGQITDHQAQAKKVTDKMAADRLQVKEAVKSLTPEQKKKVYIEFSPGWTVGKGEFMDEMITEAGGVNVASDIKGWAAINEENIIKSNPDVILYAKSVVNDKNETIADIIKARSGWNQIKAIKDNRIVALDDNLLSRPGPRVTEGLLEVAKAIYPDLVK
ncbi:iron complex transport system substrate-binding protein [Paenibacillus shirakamiensis]|uniref:Iron complex transport system substrate-binding protein n=1 Tax=Paenibacillus shirakamiensis TaxID=1265935 RepID=A0ABS4JHT7_9BACL|nr:ABC transporter substrate-binding protein [Paenibacillus shirakamiensis]MBP2000531.1 iron complex transport system substrate-binding protein [Paenibacillus shirakamiensis]